ncbi:hypothetical protein PR048_023408 [Dryococelus australis]|uniref:Uncharacterized protein n=1 Tax=Dryococelus australis TaxID=614101 RepID=A0ABQ9GU32_9NEOP|nr:hypothetical protein PR048_023408 [Dryococelus australis]
MLKRKGRNTEFMKGWITELKRKRNDHTAQSKREEKVEEVQVFAVWMMDGRFVGCDAGDGWVWVVSHLAVEFLAVTSGQVGLWLYIAQVVQKFDGCVSWPDKNDK